MKNGLKRFGVSLLAFILLTTMMPLNVFATQSRSENFSKGYTLTGNGANDMCAIALAQYQKTGSQLGYTEDWCADFVSDCAKLAGLGNIIPAHGVVSALYQNTINAGGTVVSSPQVGDLAIIDWNKNGGYGHVEIVYQVSGNTIYTIGGNSGPNTSSLYTSQVWKHTLSLTSGYFTKFVRPAYSSGGSSESEISTKSPIGNLDGISGGVNSISMYGWAFDPDTVNKAVSIHVYVDGVFSGETTANLERNDVNNVHGCGAYHGFNTTFEYNVTATGKHKVDVYALDTVYGASATLLASKEVTVKEDSTVPIITNSKVTACSEGYIVTCDVADPEGISKVQFPTWTTYNGGDDLAENWTTSSLVTGEYANGKATFIVKRSDHNNEYGKYITDIYAFNKSGKMSDYCRHAFYIEDNSIVFTEVDVVSDKDGYTVTSKVKSENGLDTVYFPTWTADDQKEAWEGNPDYAGTIEGDSVSFRVNKSDYNNKTGKYFTDIHAYDKNGKEKKMSVVVYMTEKHEYEMEPLASTEYNGKKYLLFEVVDSAGEKLDWFEATAYCQSLGGNLATITSQEENDAIKKLVESYGDKCWIGASDFEKENDFIWETGEDFGYTNWAQNEPANYDGWTGKEEDAVVMKTDGYWQDEVFEASRAFVCEIPLEVLGHKAELRNAKEATCTETGYTGDKVCTVCGEVVESGKEIAATGHKWSSWVSVKNPTTTEEGLEIRVCQICEAVEEKKIDKLPGSSNPFIDVPAGEYYTEPVLWAVEQGITSGLKPNQFAPDASCTRGQVVTFLWRAHGCPEPKSTTHNFTDLKTNEYYYKAVLWAVEKGITSGMTKTTFEPDATVTRGQFVTFLHRAEGKPAYTVSNPFTDLKTGEYYYDAVLWAVENKVTSGLKPTLFGPEEPCTRGQVVTFLYRAYNE